MIITRYEARLVDGSVRDRWVVTRRRLWGLWSTTVRIAEWDGCTWQKDGSKPDWYWINDQGKRTPVMVKGAARRALCRAKQLVDGLIPSDWTEIPQVRIRRDMLRLAKRSSP